MTHWVRIRVTVHVGHRIGLVELVCKGTDSMEQSTAGELRVRLPGCGQMPWLSRRHDCPLACHGCCKARLAQSTACAEPPLCVIQDVCTVGVARTVREMCEVRCARVALCARTQLRCALPSGRSGEMFASGANYG